MAAGHDSSTVDEEVPHEHPGEGEPVGGHQGDDVVAGHDHDDHGHDAHDDHGHDAHDDHGSGGDRWVLIPLLVGLVIGLILAAYFGLASGASPLG
ncbi:hypothetical protein [Aquihabitans sp. McL0605]|uniref:hypothetical protein n=1 Tax=Aquihabitans sp. McL0605 TaxID=3415671 RepID=UPI003CE83276